MEMPKPSPVLDLADALADQRRRWANGERVLVEAYLEANPALRGDREGLLDLIYSEIFLRERQGDLARLEEYLERFPHLAQPLRVQFEVHQAIQAKTASPEDSGRVQQQEDSGSRQAPLSKKGLELLEEIGRGGMGIVYRARDRKRGLVAVKILRPQHLQNRSIRKRFLAESRAVLALPHPHIVKVYQAGECAEGPYLVMELIEGSSLEKLMAGGPLPISQAVALLLPVIQAIAHAHAHGIIHRDLKPSNIILDPARGPLVVDFGMAKVLVKSIDDSTTASGIMVGTPAFMPPEQTGQDVKNVGPHSDIYSLGAILYALLAGRPPFAETSVIQTLLKVRSADPPPLSQFRSDVSPHLEAICRMCLAKSPAQRYASAQELGDALAEFV